MFKFTSEPFKLTGDREMTDYDLLQFLFSQSNKIANFLMWFSQFTKESQLNMVYLFLNKTNKILSAKGDHPENCTCTFKFKKKFPECSQKFFIVNQTNTFKSKAKFSEGYEIEDITKKEINEINEIHVKRIIENYTPNTQAKSLYFYRFNLENKIPFRKAIEVVFLKIVRKYKFTFIERALPEYLRFVDRIKYSRLQHSWCTDLLNLYELYDKDISINHFEYNHLFTIIIKPPTIVKSININKHSFIQLHYIGNLVQICCVDNKIYTFDKYGLKIQQITFNRTVPLHCTFIGVYNEEKNSLYFVDLIFWNVNLLNYNVYDRYRLLEKIYNEHVNKYENNIKISVAPIIENVDEIYSLYKYNLIDNLFTPYNGIIIKNDQNEQMEHFEFNSTTMLYISKKERFILTTSSELSILPKPGILIPINLSKYKIYLVGFVFQKNFLQFLTFKNYTFIKYFKIKFIEMKFKNTILISYEDNIQKKVYGSIFKIQFNNFTPDKIPTDIIKIEWSPKTSLLDTLIYHYQ